MDAIRPRDLTDGVAESINPHEEYEGMRFAQVDLGGRQLTGASFSECEFDDLSAHEADLRFATFADTTFTRLNAPIFVASRSEFRNVNIDASRLSSAELYEANWRFVRVSNCKLGFVNFRGATLQDVLFENCTIDEIDLGGAKATRVAFTGTQVGALDVTRATLNHVDFRGIELRHLTGLEGLKGATMNPDQVVELAPIFAAQFGINIED